MIAENPPRRHLAAIGAGAALLLVTAAVSLTSRPGSPQQLSMGDMIGYFAALLKAEPGRPTAGMFSATLLIEARRSPTGATGDGPEGCIAYGGYPVTATGVGQWVRKA